MSTLVSCSQKFALQKWVPVFLALTLLTIPLSSTAKSICLVLSILAILSIPEYRADLTAIVTTRWCKAALFLFAIALVACLWSPASLAQKGLVLEKYSKLLYLPVLVAGFQNLKTRQLSLHGFFLAIIITCGLSVLKFHGFLQAFTFDPDYIFHNHIVTGFMVAFAAYLALLFSYRNKGAVRVTYGLLALLFSYQVLFISNARTGYIIYLLLMMILVLQLSTWRQAVVGMAIVVVLFAGIYLASPVMKMRVDAIVQQITRYQNNDKNTDIGVRLEFHNFAHRLFNRHPLFDNGTASFTYSFDQENPVPVWDRKLLEPHSQYWLIAAEFGLLGIAALFYFFLALIQASLKLDKMKAIALAMMVPFMIGNVSDSLLLYSGPGYFFILFMAMCLGEGLEKQKKSFYYQPL